MIVSLIGNHDSDAVLCASEQWSNLSNVTVTYTLETTTLLRMTVTRHMPAERSLYPNNTISNLLSEADGQTIEDGAVSRTRSRNNRKFSHETSQLAV